MKRVVAFIIFVLLAAVMANYLFPPRVEPDKLAKSQCLEYASRDHEKEFNPERWETVVEPMQVTTEQWYEWCINNIQNPVVRE